MKKNTQYIIGGVAVIGIIAYLYNQKKKSDALKSTFEALPPDSAVGNDLIVPNFGDTTPVGVDNLIINPDGSVVDASVISLMTSPSVSNVTTSPSKETTSPTNTTTTSTPSKVAIISAPARFDGGFEYATGSNCDPILGL